MPSRCPHNMVNFGPLTAEIGSGVWGTPANFIVFRVLAALLHGSECQPNFAALNRGRHLCSAGRPSRWALAHIIVLFVAGLLAHCCGCFRGVRLLYSIYSGVPEVLQQPKTLCNSCGPNVQQICPLCWFYHHAWQCHGSHRDMWIHHATENSITVLAASVSSPVYTIQPVVKPPLSNRLTTGCIMYTNIQPASQNWK